MAIKAFFSNQAGAPVLDGTIGSLIAVLDGCLVDGYNQVSVSTITRSGSTVTVTCAAAHGYDNPATTYYAKNGVGNIALVSGAAETEYNGDWPITYVSPTVFTYDIGSATPATPANGTIVTRRAGGGFSKVYSATNRGVYRSNDLTSRRHYWQVNDTADCPNGQGARYAGWRGYESMTGIDTGDGPFPTIIQAGVFGEYVCKSSAADSGARHWALYTDGKTVIIVLNPSQGGMGVDRYSYVAGFGDLLSVTPDAYATFCAGLSNGSTVYNANVDCGLLTQAGGVSANPNSGAGWTALARKYTGVRSPVWSSAIVGMGMSQTGGCIGFSGPFMFPDGLSNRFLLTQLMMYEPTALGAVLRGSLPLYESGVGVAHIDREIIGNIVGREGRVFQYIRSSNVNSNGTVGGVYVDLTGNSSGKWS